MTELKSDNPKITKQLQTIWKELGDTPVNDDMEIERDFGGFPAGTSAEDIWHWIEATFDVPVHELMQADMQSNQREK